MDVLIVLTQLRLCAGRVDWSVGEGLALLQTRRNLDSVHCTRFLVLVPCRSSDIASHNSFNGEDLVLPHLHTTVLQGCALGFGDLRREVEGDEVSSKRGDSFLENLEPCFCAEG